MHQPRIDSPTNRKPLPWVPDRVSCALKWVCQNGGYLSHAHAFGFERSMCFVVCCGPDMLLPRWEFPKIGVPYFGVLIIRVLPFRVPY